MARCTAKSGRSGEQCKQNAIHGATVCVTHGGSAPQVKAAAKARLAAMIDPALGTLDYAMRQRSKKLREALTAAKDVLDRSPEFAAVHKYEDLSPAAQMTPQERLARLEQLRAELFGTTETVQ